MTFSVGFLETIIYGSLIWCAIMAVSLGVLLIRDLMKGDVW